MDLREGSSGDNPFDIPAGSPVSVPVSSLADLCVGTHAGSPANLPADSSADIPADLLASLLGDYSAGTLADLPNAGPELLQVERYPAQIDILCYGDPTTLEEHDSSFQ